MLRFQREMSTVSERGLPRRERWNRDQPTRARLEQQLPARGCCRQRRADTVCRGTIIEDGTEELGSRQQRSNGGRRGGGKLAPPPGRGGVDAARIANRLLLGIFPPGDEIATNRLTG